MTNQPVLIFPVNVVMYFVLVLIHVQPTQKEYYKITKIVRAFLLAERRVCMRVCKNDCVT